MLVVTNEQARRVGRKRGLTRARKAKEYGRGMADRIHARRAVHGKDVILKRQQIVHHREDALLDFAGKTGTRDNDHALGEVDEDGRLGTHAIALGVALIARRHHHTEVRLLEVHVLAHARTHEHLLDEERLARALARHKERTRVVAVGTGKAAGDKEVALGKIGCHTIAHALVDILGDRHVCLPPGDSVVDLGRVDDKAILGRATRVGARFDNEGAV